MTGSRKKFAGVVLAAGAVLAVGGCSRPDLNAPPRLTGDKQKAVPTTATTEAPTTTLAAPTTLYYSPTGPGAAQAAETTTTTTPVTTSTAAK